MTSIRMVRNNLQNFIELQERVIESVKSVASKVNNETHADHSALTAVLSRLVTANDVSRFTELDKVMSAAGLSPRFVAYAQEWNERDRQNRDERAALIKQWGTPQVISAGIDALKSELEMLGDVIPKIKSEIDSFDATTEKIKAHNQAYPAHMIKDGDADKYRKATIGMFLSWVTFINRGPYKAYRTLASHEKQFGDYFADARTIDSARKNHSELTAKQEASTKSYKELTGIASRIQDLDRGYKSPEGIAADIAGFTKDLLLKNGQYTTAFLEDVKDASAATAVHLVSKIHAFGLIAEKLKILQSHAIHNLEQLKEPESVLRQGVSVVPNENVNFDFFSLENAMAAARKRCGDYAAMAQQACVTVDNYNPGTSFGYGELSRQLNSMANVEITDTRMDLDFSGLVRAVRAEIAEYERQQELERQRRAEEARKAREAAAALLAAAARRSSSGGSSGGFSPGGGSDNIFGGSNGIGRRR